MADVSKLKKASRLGPPPAAEEASQNLNAPEVAPAAPASVTPVAGSTTGHKRRDMRSARKTGRVLPFSTRVSQAFDEQMRDIAERDGLLLAELLEKALAAYEAQCKQ